MDFNNYNRIFFLILMFTLSCEKPTRKSQAIIYYKNISANREYPQGVKVNGLKQGLWIDYDTLGHIRSSVSFLDGIENGEFRLFSELGVLVQKVDIIDGKYDGHFEHYNEKGVLYLRGIYNNNKRVGTWEVYDDYGKLIEEEVWQNGQLIKKEKK
jgi:antitoxin component YwqK of YwqJK toxin-antitoxin module